MNWMWDAGDMFGGLGNLGGHPLAQSQYAVNQLAIPQHHTYLQNAYANAYAPPPDTLETWFERLERRVNGLLDRGEFMSELEHMRWTSELEGWRGKAEPPEI